MQVNRITRIGLVLLAGVAGLAAWGAAPPVPVPPWQRLLQGPTARQAQALRAQWLRSYEAGDYTGAAEAARQLVKLREKEQGADHWQTVEARWDLLVMERAGQASQADRDAFRTIPGLWNQASGLSAKGFHDQAQPLYDKILTVNRKVLGEDHPDTADSYNSVAYNLDAQGKLRQTPSLYEKALAINRKLLGEDHPQTANCYNYLALNLDARGQFAYRFHCDKNGQQLH